MSDGITWQPITLVIDCQAMLAKYLGGGGSLVHLSGLSLQGRVVCDIDCGHVKDPVRDEISMRAQGSMTY